MNKNPLFRAGHLVQYQESIQYDDLSPVVFLYILEVKECTNHREEYDVLIGDTIARLIFDCTMGLPRWYYIADKLKYIRPVASYDESGTIHHNPRLFAWT